MLLPSQRERKIFLNNFMLLLHLGFCFESISIIATGSFPVHFKTAGFRWIWKEPIGELPLCRKPKYFHLSCLFRWQDSELHVVIKSLEYHAKSPPEILEAPLFLPLLTPELKSKGKWGVEHVQ